MSIKTLGEHHGSTRNLPVVIIATDQDCDLDPSLYAVAQELGVTLVNIGLTHEIPTSPRPKGAIVYHWPNTELRDQFMELGRPVVSLHPAPDWSPTPLPSVLFDKHAQGRLAAQYFHGHGLKHLAYVGNDPWSAGQALHEGFEAEANKLGMSYHLHRWKEDFTLSHDEKMEDRKRSISDWLKGVPKPVGLLGYHARMAGQLCILCHASGMKVPDEVAILSAGKSHAITRFSPVELSVIDINVTAQVREALALVKRLAAGAPPPTAPILIPPAGIIERRSTQSRNESPS